MNISLIETALQKSINYADALIDLDNVGYGYTNDNICKLISGIILSHIATNIFDTLDSSTQSVITNVINQL